MSLSSPASRLSVPGSFPAGEPPGSFPQGEPPGSFPAGEPLLRLQDYGVGFDSSPATTIIKSVSLSLAAGATLAIVGESGSGKSVLVKSIMGLVPGRSHRESGSVLFEGAELVGTKRDRLWGHRMAMIFQDPMTSLNPVMRIGTQIEESLLMHFTLSRAERKARVIELLSQVGIPDPPTRVRHYPHQLSGGMRQRVMIALALAGEPSLLIADEPTTALDVTVQREILDLLGQLQRSRSMAMILITHDLDVARGRADEIVVLYSGEVAERAPASTIFDAPKHPYTEALLRSKPRIDRDRSEPLVLIPGMPPTPLERPPGCAFEPRCDYRRSSCAAQEPPLTNWDGQEVACLFPLNTQKTAGKSVSTLHPDRSGAPLGDPGAVESKQRQSSSGVAGQSSSHPATNPLCSDDA